VVQSSAHHGDVVVEADVASAKILIEQDAAGSESLGQERRFGVGTEGYVETFIFEDDDKDVADAMIAIIIAVIAAIGSGHQGMRQGTEQHCEQTSHY
jgi:hypothetical protein